MTFEWIIGQKNRYKSQVLGTWHTRGFRAISGELQVQRPQTVRIPVPKYEYKEDRMH